MNDGTIEHTPGHVIFCYEQPLHHPIDVVWGRITDPMERARLD